MSSHLRMLIFLDSAGVEQRVRVDTIAALSFNAASVGVDAGPGSYRVESATPERLRDRIWSWMSSGIGDLDLRESRHMSDKVWVYEVPMLPHAWENAPSSDGSWTHPARCIELPDLRHANDFVDKLEMWIRPAARPLPSMFLTRAEEENFLHSFALWLRRWGRLRQRDPTPAEGTVMNPFDGTEVYVRLEPWLP